MKALTELFFFEYLSPTSDCREGGKTCEDSVFERAESSFFSSLFWAATSPTELFFPSILLAAPANALNPFDSVPFEATFFALCSSRGASGLASSFIAPFSFFFSCAAYLESLYPIGSSYIIKEHNIYFKISFKTIFLKRLQSQRCSLSQWCSQLHSVELLSPPNSIYNLREKYKSDRPPWDKWTSGESLPELLLDWISRESPRIGLEISRTLPVKENNNNGTIRWLKH